jgi:hypothetical protein
MKLLQITAVRFGEAEARSKLQMFVFENQRYGGARAPRGIDPQFVADFINQNLKPDSLPTAYAKVVDLVRFYERPDTLPTIKHALTGKESSPRDILRSAYALIAIGDLGTEAEQAQGAAYLDRFLVPNPALSAEAYPKLLEALVALAPAGSPTALTQRLDHDIRVKAPQANATAAGMMAYDKLVAVQQNDLVSYVWTIELKKLLIAAPPEVQRAELVKVYLGLPPRGSAVLNSWAARMLRKEAMTKESDPICADFEKSFAAVDEKLLGKSLADMTIVRAGHAILYLACPISRANRARYEKSGPGGDDFLWDDLPEPHRLAEDFVDVPEVAEGGSNA